VRRTLGLALFFVADATDVADEDDCDDVELEEPQPATAMTSTATALSTDPRIITKLPVLGGRERPR
jgi:hypothetical protein